MNYHLRPTLGAIFLFLAVVVLSGCKSASESDSSIINLPDLLTQGHEIKLSELCNSIDYIPLETSPDILLGVFLEIIEADGKFLIADRRNHKVSLFSNNGEFLYNIGKYGQGPGEILYFRGIDYEPDCGNLSILDMKKINRYDNKGNFINEIPLYDYGQIIGIKYWEHGQYWFTYRDKSNKYEHVSVIDTLGQLVADIRGEEIKCIEIIKGSNNGNDFILPFITDFGIFPFDKTIRIVSPNTDTIKSISSDLVKKTEYVFNFGKYRAKDDMSNKNSSIQLTYYHFKESEDNLFFTFIFPEGNYPHKDIKSFGNAVFYKQNGELKALAFNKDFEISGFVNDLDEGSIFWPNYICGNKMYQIIDAATFIEYSKIAKSLKMKKVAETLTEDSNPVIVAVKLK